MAHQIEIPTIDIGPFREDPSSGAAELVTRDVREACTTFGFLQIVGHGIDPELQSAVIQGAAEFFKLPAEEKHKLDRFLPGSCGRGYEVMRTQQQQKGLGGDFKEGFYAGNDIPRDHPVAQAHPHFAGPNKWLPDDILPYTTFRNPVETYMTEMNKLARTMFRILAAGMPYGPHVFDEFLDKVPMALLSPKHYPPSSEHVFYEGEDPSKALGCGPHTDFGSMTLLLQDQIGGLQIKHGEDNWIDVPPRQDAYVVNIGDMLQKWTRGEYKSTVHRVLSPQGSTHRYSLPFFFNGNLDARLIPFDQLSEAADENGIDGNHEDAEKTMTVQDHLLERIMATMLKAKIPVKEIST